jgi:hypothetical protein
VASSDDELNGLNPVSAAHAAVREFRETRFKAFVT